MNSHIINEVVVKERADDQVAAMIEEEMAAYKRSKEL